ncbi:MAG: DNA repair protein RecN [Alphaproteobacteria bacterium]
MLISLEIRNFLLIKNISINFNEGFNAFTGETGAGKSIIIDGLKLALGGKNNSNLNLNNNEISNIKAVFERDVNINKNLKDLNIEIEDDYLIVERQINYQQKSKILLNGQTTSQSIIKKILINTIEFQENYEQQELFDNKYFLNFIDKLGKIELTSVIHSYQNLKILKDELNEFLKVEKNINEKLEILKGKQEKFKLLNPKKKEYTSLINQRNLNKNFKKISDISHQLKKSISDFNLNNNLSIIDKNLIKLSEIDKDFKDISNSLSTNYIEINELLNDLDTRFEKYEFDEIDFDFIDERIYQYQQLSKFFNVDCENLYDLNDKIADEISLLENYENEKKKLQNKHQELLDLYKVEAKKISFIRKKTADIILDKINNELPSVNIEQGEILFKFSEAIEDNYNSKGYDILDVLFRTNVKNEFNSIKKVASGGELSRLLLIIKSLSATYDKNLTIVFDEVDSGLSGRIATNVSDKILKLSKNNQIIAITHSAQVASRANKHWKIEKKLDKNDMESFITNLDENGRIIEIATLISGSKITEESKKVARDLINEK